MLKGLRHGVALLLLGGLLSGCASTVTPPARYMLPDSQLADNPLTPSAASTRTTLGVRAPRLANYLDVDGIVMQLDDIALFEAREHQWAESLGRQLERGLRARLSRALPDYRVVRDEGNTSEAQVLRVEIDQFQGRYDGRAVASGQWQLLDAQGRLLDMQGFHAETELEDDGYPALVRALGKSVDSVADEIAARLRRQRAP